MKTLVLGVIGADVHAVGNKILDHAFTEAGYKVVNLGVMVSQDEFIKAAIETNADAIMVSSLYGQGELDCQGMREKCVEAGIGNIPLFCGGNLVVGKRDFKETEKIFKDMGFNYVYAPGTMPDVTIADYVADLRAATPSNAAELAVPDRNEVYGRLLSLEKRLEGEMGHRLAQSRRRLDRLAKSRAMTRPEAYFQAKRLLLDYQSRRLVHGLHGTLAVERERFARLAAALDALSPLKVLSRGYALTTDGAGRVLASVSGVEPGDNVTVRLADGALRCRVEAKQGGENDGGKKEVL